MRGGSVVAVLFIVFSLTGVSVGVHADVDSTDAFQTLDSKVQSVKKSVLDLGRDIADLEEKLLYPQSSKITVYFSFQVDSVFYLESIKLYLDDRLVANMLYTPIEIDALRQGALEKLYLGSLSAGLHELSIIYNGKDHKGRMIEDGTRFTFDKTEQAKVVEFVITDQGRGKSGPVFMAKEQ